jgi:hypothetical protein
MTEHLQSGYHPDADQISAFVEHALPAHEREQMLDHLASCEECRAVVAMSLPEIEEPEPARPIHTAARKSWWSNWSNWTLTWSLAGALAAILLSVVVIRHAAIAPNIQAPSQVAVSHPPETPTPQVQPPVSPAKVPPRGAPEKPEAKSLAASAGNQSFDSLSNDDASAKPSGFASVPIQGRNLTPLDQKAQAAPASSAISSLGVVSGIIAAKPPAPETRAQSMAPPKPAIAATAAEPSTRQTNQTVEVAAAPLIEEVPHNQAGLDASLDEAQITQFIRVEHPLPSRLPVLSIATQASRIVAIDTHNSVFLSKDGGKHWKSIQAPWPGRAVRASLIELPKTRMQNYNQLQTIASGATVARAAPPQNDNIALKKQDQPSAATICCGLAGTVTDQTGAVISSASVSVTNTATQAARTVRTDTAGRYLIDRLAPGTYKLEAQATGFMKQELAAVPVTDSHPNIANLSLTIASESQTVSVAADSSQIFVEAETNTKSKSSREAGPVFEIVTDNGDHWTSVDGITWKHM